MDRRQRKTRESIFKAFSELLSKKTFEQITVGEIIDLADVGRATFYAHFETKEFLLKAFCEELFCHLFDAMETGHEDHRHIFDCDVRDDVFLHLFRHLQKNDNNILKLLSCQSNELFLRYFKTNLQTLAASQMPRFAHRKNEKLPEEFWQEHIADTFVSVFRWWIARGMQESAETITEYFYLSV